MPKLFRTRMANLVSLMLLTAWIAAYWRGIFDSALAFLAFGLAMACAILIDFLTHHWVKRVEEIPAALKIGVNALMLASLSLLVMTLIQGTAR